MKKYIQTPTGFLMVLTQDDNVFDMLTSITAAENIGSASFFGIGFAGRAEFGFFNAERAAYDPKEFSRVEITNLTGTIAWKDGVPSIHAHANASDATFGAVGGHLLSLIVGVGSMEITVLVHTDHLLRKVDPKVGGNVLQLE